MCTMLNVAVLLGLLLLLFVWWEKVKGESKQERGKTEGRGDGIRDEIINKGREGLHRHIRSCFSQTATPYTNPY